MKLSKTYIGICAFIGVVIVIGLVLLYRSGQIDSFKCTACTNNVGFDQDYTEIPEKGKLLPVFDPEFNFRECAKQLILLEDHLFNAGKRCIDCIKKHFLTAEALLEEAISLDKENKYVDITSTYPKKLRELEKRLFVDKEDYITIAQEIRQLRKPLQSFFDMIFPGVEKPEECSSCSVK